MEKQVNNTIYSDLGPRWYEAKDDPVALLRAEARHRNPWVAQQIHKHFGERACSILDVGCGAGFLSNYLGELGHHVIGLDAEDDPLAVASRHDRTGKVDYQHGDALSLPYIDGSFDVVCAMDFLEHVEDPEHAVAEAARVLAPGGLFFFHTFNRNWLSWLLVIKAVEWFVRNTPDDMHVLRLFLKPEELATMCRAHGLEPVELVGVRPRFGVPAWRTLVTGMVGDDFQFKFTPSTRLAYSGYARRIVSGTT
jgi:2-polyprenyl-6-hydroxyphenyl methylase / 3-demethylubiquinone-9 3-methyltransferase